MESDTVTCQHTVAFLGIVGPDDLQSIDVCIFTLPFLYFFVFSCIFVLYVYAAKYIVSVLLYPRPLYPYRSLTPLFASVSWQQPWLGDPIKWAVFFMYKLHNLSPCNRGLVEKLTVSQFEIFPVLFDIFECTFVPPYPLIQHPRFTAARKKNLKIKN
jgi:hypothetical protein